MYYFGDLYSLESTAECSDQRTRRQMHCLQKGMRERVENGEELSSGSHITGTGRCPARPVAFGQCVTVQIRVKGHGEGSGKKRKKKEK